MSDGAVDLKAEARARAYSIPLDDINVADPELFKTDSHWPYFERLRKEDPVQDHPPEHHEQGSFWSVTKYNDIMAVDTNHGVFSSEGGITGITIRDARPGYRRPSFISSDPPRHDEQRKTISPIVGPGNLAQMEALIRERTRSVLDDLPRNQTFDWVERVSIELTTRMLATLFDFPFEDRRLLTWWSDISTAQVGEKHPLKTEDQRWEELNKCLAYFTRLWNERVNAPPRGDLVSMLAHGPATRNMSPKEFLGNLLLLIVGGNDTTRNSMTGGLLELSRNPGEWAKLRANPALVDSLVPEIIRWQTPVAHMRRTATRDVELGGKTIRKGDKVIMWYVSGNRDGEVIPQADRFLIDRTRPRQHVAFGFGIHRCVGNRLAELQLRVIWEEILKRFPEIVVVAEPRRTWSTFVKGYETMQVVIPRRL